MAINAKVKSLYDALKADGADVGTEQEFNDYFFKPGKEGYENRLAVYQAFKDDGADIGESYEEFGAWLGLHAVGRPQQTATTAQPVPDKTAQPTAVQPTVQTPAQPAARVATPTPPQTTATPTATPPATVVADFGEQTRKAVGDTERMFGAMTPEGRKKQRALEFQGRTLGRRMQLPGLSVMPPEAEQPEATEGAQAEPKAQSLRGPQYYGVTTDAETGQLKDRWVMPDGSLTTDFVEADVAAAEARTARLQREFEGRMAINGLDTGKPEDVAAQQAYDRLAQLETRAKMHSDEKLARLQERYEKASAMERGQMLIGQNGNTATSMVTMPASVYDNGIYDDEDKLIAAERKNLEDAITAHHAGRLKKTGFFFAAQNLVNAWEGTKDVFKDGDTYAAGMISMHQSAQMLAIKAKLDKGEALTRGEESLLESMLVKQAIDENVEKPHGYTMGYTIANMVPFMIQMAMNPAAGAGEKFGNMAVKEFARMMARRAGQRATKGFMMKTVAKLGKKRAAAIAKGIGVTAGDIVASAGLANTLQAPAMMADAALRHVGDVAYDKDGTLHFENGEGVIKAFSKAQGAMLIEDYTEMLGAHLGVIAGAIGRGAGKAVRKLGGGKLLDNVMKLCANIRATDWAKGVAAIERRAQWNGSVGEVLEEEAGIVLNSLLTGDNSISDLWDKEQQIDIVLGVGAFGAFVSGIRTAGYPISRHKARKALDERAATCEASFGKNWDSIRETIDMAGEADLAQTIARLGRRYATTPEKAKALLEYASAMAKARAFNIASASAEEMQTNPVQRQIDQSYNNGYTAEGSGRADVQNLYNAQKERALNTLDADTMRNLDADSPAALSGMESAGTYTDEQLGVAREYAAAKAAYDGMQQSVEDEIEAQIWRCNAAIDARTNRDTGMVQRATYGLENREVYIIKGNVAADENGVIDRAASDDTITIVDVETGETQMVASKDLVHAEQPIEVEQFKGSMAAYVRQQIGERAHAQAEGKLLFEENEKCLILDDEGSQSEVMILGGATDGQGAPIADAVEVQYADGTTGVVAMSELQEQVNAAAAVRMNYAEQERQQAAARVAVDAEAEQDGPAGEAGAQRRSFALNDEVELIADHGGVTSGMVTGEIDSDGLIEVQTDKPVNGRMVNRLTLDELMQLLTRHNGEIVDEAEVEAVATAGTPAAPGTKADEAGDSGVANVADVAEQPAGPTAQEEAPAGYGDFGPIFTQFKGDSVGAINKLIKLRTGEAIGALHHKEVGDIDLVWGIEGSGHSDGMGLAKLVKYHPEVVEHLQEILDDMRVVRRTDNRINLESDTHKAAVRLTWNHEAKKWLLTAFEKKETPESIDKTTDTGDNPADLRGDTALSQNSGVSDDGKDINSASEKQEDSKESLPKTEVSALERLPKNEKGEPIFEKAESPEVGWDALVEFAEGDAATAKEIADTMVEGKRKAYEKVRKQVAKGKTPAELLASKKAIAAALARAQGEYETWQQIANVEQGRQAEERQNNLPKDEVTSAERTEMAARIVDWLSDENLSNALGKTRDEIFEEFGNELKPIAYIPSQFVSLVSPSIADSRIYCGKGYFIDHALHNHGAAGTQVPIEDVDVSKYLNIQTVLDNPDTVKETTVDGKRTVIFIKKIGRFFAELTQVEEDGKIVLHKSLFNQKKEPYAKLNDIRQKDTSSEGGTSSISHAENSAPAISLESRGDVKGKLVRKHADDVSSASDVADGLFSSQGNQSDPVTEGTDAPQTNNVFSERKVTNSASEKQESREESSAQTSENEVESGDKTLIPEKAYQTIAERVEYSIEIRPNQNGDIFAIRLKKGAKLSEWKNAVGAYGIWSNDGRGEVQFDSFDAMLKYLESRGEEVESLLSKEKWSKRDKEINDALFEQTGIREGQTWKGPDGTIVKIGARGFVKGPDGWDFATTVVYPDGRTESTLTPATRISEYFSKHRFESAQTAQAAVEAESAERGRGAEGDKPSLLDAVRTLFEKGKAAASKLFQMKFFDVAETPDFMKALGLTGDKFTIRYGVIARHIGKDAAHEIPEEIWAKLPEALKAPFAITKYYQDENKKVQKGYRLYTTLRLSSGAYVVVSAEVKNIGRELEVNAINTIFGREALSDVHDELIYKSDTITPEQQSLLNGNNPHQYPATRELSDGKVNNSASDKQGEDVKSSVQERLASAESEVNTAPTEAQKKAGNYKMGHVEIDGLQISIENPKGSMRRGKDPNGTPWETEMKNTYGYIKGTTGVDGDKIDVFLSDNPTDGDVYVVDQYNTDGTFDEHKVMYGFTSASEAEVAYLSNYSADWAKGRKVVVTGVTREEFKKWLDASDRKKKPFAEYKSVKPIEAQNGGAAEAAKLRQKGSRLKIEGAEKLSAERAEAVERYAEGHYCVPIRVIADEADIREWGLSEAAVAQMMAALTEEDVPAVYCREDKKIYIFAGHKDSNVGSTLAHENFHALSDAIGNTEEKQRMFEAYQQALLNEPKHGSHFKEVWDAVSNAYVPEEALEEFAAYTINRIYSTTRFIGHLDRILDGEVKEYIFNNFINRIFNGTAEKSSKPANQQGNSENDGGLQGIRPGGNSAGNSRAEGRAGGGESAGREIADGKAGGTAGGAKQEHGLRAIEDFGEKLEGARKDLIRDFAKSVENVTLQSLIELPLSKAFKRPNLRKMIEAGIISDDDALLAEAIMIGLIYARNKPAMARSTRRKREIAEWAQGAFDAIRLLGEVLSGNKERLEKALAQRQSALDERLAAANRHIDDLRRWNPNRNIPYLTAIPDEVGVIRHILEAIGHKAGEKINLPLTRLEIGRDGVTYNVSGPTRQGALWFKKYHSSKEDALNTMIFAARLLRGDADIEIPEDYLAIRGIGMRHQKPTGKYEVLYWGRNGKELKTAVYGDKQKAEEFAKAHDGRVSEQMQYTNEYDRYTTTVINPITGNRHQIGQEFADRAELAAWMDEQHDEVSALAAEAIAKEIGTKSGAREHFRVTATWRNGEMVYSIVSNDKNNPWPIIQDFPTRREAEEHLASIREELEENRRKRIEREKSVVYFKTGEKRKGPDRRNGKDATPEMYDEAFGFRGVQFGNWTNAEDRQMAMNQAYDALMDLAEQLGLSPRALSLYGELGLAFGARGMGGASAHYEPSQVVINLTKTRGAGALAHEWWHALDNYLARHAGVTLGHATHGNGSEAMEPDVREVVNDLIDAVVGSNYGRRSAAKGDYWGRRTEMTARLFETWISERIKGNGDVSPFLASGLDEGAINLYQAFNYYAYKANERRQAKLEKREPNIMSREEFNKTPESLNGYPYPVVNELGQFVPRLERLFEVLAGREQANGTMVNEPRRRYGPRKPATTTGMSLFDWADAEERGRMGAEAKDDKDITAKEANAALDGFAENYSRWLEHSAEVEAQLDAEGVEGELRDELSAQMESEETRIAEERDKLEERLRGYYAIDNTPEDATRIARDMVGRMQAEVEIRHRKEHILSDLLNGSDEAPIETTSDEVAAEEKTAEVKTGGGFISYNALGHLPDAKEGEFAYVERKFSRTGEFSFTGADRIHDRGDVAYLFRSLENYSVENVFAVLVKDGKARVLHIGMGTATSSLADMSAIRAGVDAFGADRIYLVHNHPSGTMIASQQDRNLMRTLEAAFGDKIDVSGIIIDTTSGRYVEFNGDGQAEVYDRPRQSDGEKMADVFHFDQADRSNMPEETMAIRSSSDVANAIGNLRFGDGKRVSYLILAHNGHVIGNFHTECTDINASGLAEEIASVASKYGGTSVVVYGNMPLDGVMRLKDAVARHSLGAVRLLDTLGVRNGIQMSAVDEGMLYEDGTPYGPVEAREPMVAARGREAFDALRDRAVAERGSVAVGLNEAEVRVVEVTPHDFAGEYPIAQAKTWAREHIVGEHEMGNGTLYTISNSAVDKYLSQSATGKSENLGVHLSVLKQLPEVIGWSIDAEVHPDYKKGPDGVRRAENGIGNSEMLVHRLYGAVVIDGVTYRVKTTLHEFAPTENVKTAPHSFEVTKIEVLEESNTSGGAQGHIEKTSTLPLGIANLLKGVEKSYDPGKKLLDESEKSELFRQGDGRGRFGRDRFGEKRQAELAARERERMAARIRELAERLHLYNVEVVTDASQLEGVRATAKGFFNKRTGKITIVLPNNISVLDAEQTLLHEAVAHYGLRKLLGDKFDSFLDNVYESATEEIRRKIAEMAARNGWNFRTATEEYLAGLAENTDFDAIHRTGWWSKMKRLFLDMLEKVGFDGFRDRIGVVLTDNELRYILWRSYANLAEPGATRSIFGEAADIARQAELKVGNYAPTAADVAMAMASARIEAIGATFDEQLEQFKSGELKQGHRFELGMPSEYLRSAGFPNLPISMRASLLDKKASMQRHPFSADDIRGLVQAIQKPIAIFSYSKENMRNLIVDIMRGDKHFLVGVTLNYKAGDIEINSVSGLFPKDSQEWLKWIQDGKAIRIDQKEKVQAIIDSQRTTNTVESERIGLNLEVVANVVKSFENPVIEDEDSLLFRSSGPAREEYDRRVRVKEVDRNNKSTYKTVNRAAQLNEAYLDSMRSLRVLQEAVSHETGKPIEDFENAYMEENQMSSRNATAEEEYKRDFFEPLCRAVSDICKGSEESYGEMLDYILAKHGLERNQYMRAQAQAARRVGRGRKAARRGHAKRRRKKGDIDYSGLTALTGESDVAAAEREAAAMVAAYEAAHDTSELWRRINAATAETLRTRYQSGLIGKDVYDKIRSQYHFYVPLKGWADVTAMDMYEYAANGYGLGSALMTAYGRSSVADDPLATIMVDAQRTIMEANRNLMKQKFLNLALNHRTSLLTVSRQWYVEQGDGTWKPEHAPIPDGADADTVDAIVKQFEAKMKALGPKAKTIRAGLQLDLITKNADISQHIVRVKRNGETFCIYVNGDPIAARAINGMLNPDAGEKTKAEQIAQEVKNFMSKTFTTWNPEFVVGNLFMDLMYAGTAVAVKENKAYARQYTKNISGIFFKAKLPRLLNKWQHGQLDESVAVERYFAEFMRNGGETGFTQLNTVDKAKRDMQRFLREAQGGPASLSRRAWRGFWGGVEFMNRSAEDTTRFAVYMTSRQQGRSVSRSISDAKEITVNFNKKGSGAWGARAMNFLFVFFNASMQGLANAGRLVRRHPGKASAAMGTFMSAGFFIPMLSCTLQALWGSGDGDDDGADYWDLPEWTRRSNIVIYIPFTKKFITIPIAHELRPFYGMGEIAYSVMCGKETVEDGLWKAAEGFTALLPLDITGNGGDMVANFSPTIVQPVVQISRNVDYFGKPIYKDTSWNKDDPEWTKAYKGTNGVFVDVSRMLSESMATTDEYGVVSYPQHWYSGDINPAWVEHLLESYTGGLGKTVNGVGKTISMLWSEDARELRNIPVARKLLTTADEQAKQRRFSNSYFKIREEYEKSKKYLSELRGFDKSGAGGVSDRVRRWIDTEAGRRYKLQDKYFKKIRLYQGRMDKEVSDSQLELIRADMDSIKRELVQKTDSLNSAGSMQQR